MKKDSISEFGSIGKWCISTNEIHEFNAEV